MQLMKRIFGLLCVVFCVGFLMMPVKADAASEKSKALKAYEQLLKEKASEEKANADKYGYTYTARTFLVAYVDNNSVPELYYDGTLYTYKSGEVVEIETPYSGYVWYGYYKKTGIAVTYYGHSSTGTMATSDVYSYVKLKGVNTQDAKLSKSVFTSYNSSGKKTATSYSYYAAGKTTKKAYTKRLKKLAGSKKLVVFSKSGHKNTAKNRKKYLQ